MRRILIFSRDWQCLFNKSFGENSGQDTDAAALRMKRMSISELQFKNKCLLYEPETAPSMASDDSAKLIMGVVYSMRTVLSRMDITRDSKDESLLWTLQNVVDFSFEHPPYKCFFAETITGWRIVLVIDIEAAKSLDASAFMQRVVSDVLVEHLSRSLVACKSSDGVFLPFQHIPSVSTLLESLLDKFVPIPN